MIAVAPATWRALIGQDGAESVKLDHVATWAVAGGSLDISDRLMDATTPSRTVLPYLAGGAVTPTTVILDNSDLGLSRTDPDSVLYGIPPEEVFMSQLSLSLRVEHDYGTEDIPTGSTFVSYANAVDGRVELTLRDILTTLLAAPLPEAYVLPHVGAAISSGLGDAFVALLNDYTPFSSSADIETYGGWDVFRDRTQVMGWPTTGTINAGTPIGDALQALCRSGLCNLVAGASGRLRFLPLWPARASTGYPVHDYPIRIDESNAWGWSDAEGLPVAATEVQVEYRGVRASYRNTTLEDRIGRRQVSVPMPFLATSRQAWYAARYLYETFAGFSRVIGFTMGAPGIVLEPWDRVTVRPPSAGADVVARVVSVRVTRGGVQVEASPIGIEDSVIDGDFPTIGVDSWDTKAVL